MLQAELKVVEGKQQGKAVPLNVKKFLIGREQDCQLRPNSDQVSRHHCVFTIDDYTVRLRDLGSTNGTIVNGERIQGQVVLKEGDLIQIGKLSFQLVIRQPAPVAEDVPAEMLTDEHLEGPADEPIPMGDETMVNYGETHEFAHLNAEPLDGDTAVIPAGMIPQPGAYPPAAEAYQQPPAAAYPPPGAYPAVDQYGQPMQYPPGMYPQPYPYPPQPAGYPQYPQYPPPGTYPPPGYPPPGAYPMPPGYPPGVYPPQGYPQQMPYGAPPQPVVPPPAEAPALAPGNKSVMRTVKEPPLSLPPPEETGAKETTIGSAPPVGTGKTDTKNPSLAAADIIRKQMHQRPK